MREREDQETQATIYLFKRVSTQRKLLQQHNEEEKEETTNNMQCSAPTLMIVYI